jgi:hypothetical protein
MAAPVDSAPAGDLPAWCPALRDVALLVHARDRFARIIGQPREGNYLETTLPLPGWGDCSFYGARTYVCDSQSSPGADAATLAFAKILSEVKECLQDGWAEDASLASPGYAVIRENRQAASITLNTDQTDKNKHVVRLILLLRSRGPN